MVNKLTPQKNGEQISNFVLFKDGNPYGSKELLSEDQICTLDYNHAKC